MWGIPNAATWQKIGRNERLGVPSTKWLLLTPERYPHHTRPTFTRSTLLRGQVPHTARNKRSAVACHFLPAILALFGENFTRKCTDFWGYRVDCTCKPLTGCMNNSLRAKGKTHAIGSVKYHSLALMPSVLPYRYYILLFSDLPYRL